MVHDPGGVAWLIISHRNKQHRHPRQNTLLHTAEPAVPHHECTSFQQLYLWDMGGEERIRWAVKIFHLKITPNNNDSLEVRTLSNRIQKHLKESCRLRSSFGGDQAAQRTQYKRLIVFQP